jgi:hypothetical protein
MPADATEMEMDWSPQPAQPAQPAQLPPWPALDPIPPVPGVSSYAQLREALVAAAYTYMYANENVPAHVTDALLPPEEIMVSRSAAERLRQALPQPQFPEPRGHWYSFSSLSPKLPKPPKPTDESLKNFLAEKILESYPGYQFDEATGKFTKKNSTNENENESASLVTEISLDTVTYDDAKAIMNLSLMESIIDPGSNLPQGVQ